MAPADYRVLGKASNWLSFEGISGVTIIGGALDAKGSALWACKAARTNCPKGATVLHLYHNSFHNFFFFFFYCKRYNSFHNCGHGLLSLISVQ